MPETPHIPVLLSQTLESFASIKEGTIIDCTLGYGGHTQALLDSNPAINVIGIDRDQTAIDFACSRLQNYGERFRYVKGDFASSFKKAVDLAGRENVKGVLADIGVSSLQLDQLDRGFGFDSDVLDMRMDQNSTLDAKTVVNTYSLDELTQIFRKYGELPYARNLAKDVVAKRPFSSAKDLSELAMKYKGKKKIHPATLMFQAIRIEVNDELGQLTTVLETIKEKQLEGSIVSIISFHSLEDRIVKQCFRKWSISCICPHGIMRCECGNNHALGKELHKKPRIADSIELGKNPRSRSAKIRSFQFGTRTTI